MKITSYSLKDTQKIAQNLAKKIIKNNLRKQAITIALEGELGAGKTTFVKGFARALGIKSYITSPTFVLLKRYKLPNFAKTSSGGQVTGYKLLFHIDAYRLKNYSNLLPLGIKNIIAEPTNIILIEWSERVKQILPHKHIKVHIDHIDEHSRKITIS